MNEDLSIRDVRLQKLARMRELGSDPFQVERFDRSHSAKEMLDKFEEGKRVSFAGRVVSYRLMGKAGFAHISDGDDKIQGYFRKDDLGEVGWELYNLLDTGDHIGVEGRLFVTKTGEKSIHVDKLTPLSKSLQNIPLGKEKDGHVYYGLTDVDLRYRHRHLDLLCNAEVRKSLISRMKITSAVRRFMDARGYLEVETPMLQMEAGGAAARPFTTRYNAYDIDVKLRISLELYLKRIICGDIPKVYEIGRVFRNEGVSNRHSPEFTMLEFYEAYSNLEDIMVLVEEMFKKVAIEVFGSTVVHVAGDPNEEIAHHRTIQAPLKAEGHFIRRVENSGHYGHCWVEIEPLPAGSGIVFENLAGEDSIPARYALACEEGIRYGLNGNSIDDVKVKLIGGSHHEEDSSDESFKKAGILAIEQAMKLASVRPADGRTIDFGKPWRRIDLLGAIEEHAGIQRSELQDLESAKAAMERVGLPTGKENNLGGIIEKLLERFVEPTLIEPTFMIGYPIETSPLAKKDPANPRMTRRFEGYVRGREICNAFSEINDPIDQRERFEQQMRERAKGDDEAHPLDEEFLFALESGMPPTGGCGIGIDRMAMLLTGAEHIREVMLFPTMKPTKELN